MFLYRIETMSIDPTIFRAYDIRGIYGETLTNKTASRLADAFVHIYKPKTIVVGRDMRTSSPALTNALTERLNVLGVTVKDIGMVSTEVFYYGCGSQDIPGIMVTASHNPPQYNGFKLIKKLPFAVGKGQGMEEVRDFACSDVDAEPIGAQAATELIDVWPGYLDKMCSFLDVTTLSKFTVVADAANGMAGVIWKKLSKRLPVNLIALNFEPDGTFPAHEPDPLVAENRIPTENGVKINKADVGFSYDADVDRCFVIDNTGVSLPGEFVTALMAEYFLEKEPGAGVLYDVRSSWVVRDEVERLGGIPFIERVGHAYIKKTMKEKNAVLGGEVSGHFYTKDFFFADSGIVASMIMLAIMQKKGKPIDELVADWKEKYQLTGEINFTVEDSASLFEEVKKKFSDGTLTEIDGILIEYQDWHFSLRSSNTEPLVRLNIEAINNKELLEEKKSGIIKIIESYS